MKCLNMTWRASLRINNIKRHYPTLAGYMIKINIGRLHF